MAFRAPRSANMPEEKIAVLTKELTERSIDVIRQDRDAQIEGTGQSAQTWSNGSHATLTRYGGG